MAIRLAKFTIKIDGGAEEKILCLLDVGDDGLVDEEEAASAIQDGVRMHLHMKSLYCPINGFL